MINEYTNNESGVRNIKRCIEDIFLKINLLKLMKNGNKNTIDINYHIENLSFPLLINIDIIKKLINKN
jgi:ATP-dependent Lon protease